MLFKVKRLNSVQKKPPLRSFETPLPLPFPVSSRAGGDRMVSSGTIEWPSQIPQKEVRWPHREPAPRRAPHPPKNGICPNSVHPHDRLRTRPHRHGAGALHR